MDYSILLHQKDMLVYDYLGNDIGIDQLFLDSELGSKYCKASIASNKAYEDYRAINQGDWILQVYRAKFMFL